MASFFAEIAQNPTYYGLWIQSGAVFVSAILVIATILWNSRIAQRRATLDMLIGERQSGPHQRYRQAFVALQKEGHLVQYLAPDRLASDEAQTIQYVLNTYELAAIGVRRDIVHSKLYKQWCRTTMVVDWRSCKPFVVELRRITAVPTYYCEFEKLAKKWATKEERKLC